MPTNRPYVAAAAVSFILSLAGWGGAALGGWADQAGKLNRVEELRRGKPAEPAQHKEEAPQPATSKPAAPQQPPGSPQAGAPAAQRYGKPKPEGPMAWCPLACCLSALVVVAAMFGFLHGLIALPFIAVFALLEFLLGTGQAVMFLLVSALVFWLWMNLPGMWRHRFPWLLTAVFALLLLTKGMPKLWAESRGAVAWCVLFLTGYWVWASFKIPALIERVRREGAWPVVREALGGFLFGDLPALIALIRQKIAEARAEAAQKADAMRQMQANPVYRYVQAWNTFVAHIWRSVER